MSRRRIFILSGLVPLMLALGCAAHLPSPYEQLIQDQKDLIEDVAKVLGPGEDSPGDAPSPMKLPSMEARYCLERAKYDIRRANTNSGWDTALVVIGGLLLTNGTVSEAIGAALPKNADGTAPGARPVLDAVGAASLAGAAGVLALRTGLQLSEVGRAERIAAAKNVDAAISILQYYATADDPTDPGQDGFATCRDGEIDIARAFPGVGSSPSAQAQTPAQKLTGLWEQAKAEKAKAVDTTAAAETDAARRKEIWERAWDTFLSATGRAIDAVATAAKNAPGPAQKLKEATERRDDAATLQKDYGVARESATTASEAKRAGEEAAGATEETGTRLRAVADAVDGAKPGGKGNTKPDTVAEIGAAAEEAAKAAAAAMRARSEADAAAAEAKADQARKEAKADVAQTQLDLFQAIARWRRALFFQTATERRLAGEIVKQLREELEHKWKALRALEARKATGHDGSAK